MTGMEHSYTTRRFSVRRRLVALALGLLAVGAVIVPLSAQDLSQIVSTATPGQAAPLTYNNRQITVFRATVLSRSPAERAQAAQDLLDRIVSDGTPAAVSSRPLQGVIMVSVGGRDVFGILPLDLDALAGETQQAKTAEAVAHLQQALDEAVESRTPGRIARAVALSLLATALVAALFWATVRLHRWVVVRAATTAERKLKQLSAGEVLVSASRAPQVVRKAVTVVLVALWLFLGYNWLTFVLRRFPYTRPWGESLRAFLTDQLAFLGTKIVNGIPDLFTVFLILLFTRFVVRLCQVLFQAVEEGRLSMPYVYAETAQPTRRLVTTVIWLLGVVLAYPYLPGSESDAFKGVSVFIGLVLSLGSSGIVNQMMSGLCITYSRAVRPGDFVKMGDVEGTVLQVGVLSIKVKTARREEVTIPNAVVMSQVTTNYSRFADTEGVFVPTSLTIGYDTPWRQVHALLLLAAERTPGVRSDPKPVVRQSALQDFYVQYTLLVCLDAPQQRLLTLDALHANIQDAFNEYGVQIMSPNYEADPEGRKFVPVDQWYAAPAARADAAAEQIRR
jgi:small-conductance mechanosensitive channel